MFKVSTDYRAGYFKIYVNGVLHIKFAIDDFAAIQSYHYQGSCYIEIHLKGADPVSCSYNTEDKWKKVLKALDDM